MSVVAIERRINGVLASADTAILAINNRDGTPVVLPTTVLPTSVGSYSYTTSFLPPGSYTALWTFQVSGFLDDTVERAFVVDSPLQSYEGYRLMDLEAAVARRCGQYRKVRGGSASSSTTVQSLRLKSSQNLGTFETEYVLRRGLLWDGTLVPNFVEDDRVRGIVEYTPSSGLLGVDRPYTLTPVQDEQIELIYLEPEDELRPDVIDGLKRCFFWDTILFQSTSGFAPFDLTAIAPWITSPSQVKSVGYSSGVSRRYTQRLGWYRPYLMGSHVQLEGQGIGAGYLMVTALRPYYSYVNGEISFTGPNDDLDVLTGDMDYAAWAGVLEVWKNHPERLTPVAHENMRPSLQQAADEFTKKSLMLVDQIPEVVQVRWDTSLDLGQIGNLPEMPT